MLYRVRFYELRRYGCKAACVRLAPCDARRATPTAWSLTGLAFSSTILAKPQYRRQRLVDFQWRRAHLSLNGEQAGGQLTAAYGLRAEECHWVACVADSPRWLAIQAARETSNHQRLHDRAESYTTRGLSRAVRLLERVSAPVAEGGLERRRASHLTLVRLCQIRS